MLLPEAGSRQPIVFERANPGKEGPYLVRPRIGLYSAGPLAVVMAATDVDTVFGTGGGESVLRPKAQDDAILKTENPIQVFPVEVRPVIEVIINLEYRSGTNALAFNKLGGLAIHHQISDLESNAVRGQIILETVARRAESRGIDDEVARSLGAHSTAGLLS
jgi:hypothetical protein